MRIRYVHSIDRVRKLLNHQALSSLRSVICIGTGGEMERRIHAAMRDLRRAFKLPLIDPKRAGTLPLVLVMVAGLQTDLHAAVTVGTGATVKTSTLGSNDIAFQGGTLVVDNSGTFSNNATLQSSNSAVVSSTIDAQGNSGTFSGVFSTSSASNSFQGALVIADSVGGGRISLAGVNTYTGNTTINSGATLALVGSGSIAASAVVTNEGILDISQTTNGASLVSLAGGGQILLGTRSLSITNGTGTFSGVISGTGGLVVSGGTLYLDNANTYTGGTTVSRGTLQIGTGNNTGSILGDVSVGGTLAFNRADNITFDGLISGTGGVSQLGSGILTLTRNETYSGTTTISSGTLALSATGSIANSNSVAVDGTFDISAAAGTTIKSLSGTGTVQLGSQTLTITAASGTFSGIISGSGGLTLNSGTQTLTGANTYTGPTTVNGGTLLVGASSITYNVSNSGTFGFSSASPIAMNGVVSGSGALLQSGSGTTTISVAQSYSGITTISSGTLALSGSGSIASSSNLINNGTFSISAAGGPVSITSLSGAGTVQLGGLDLILTNASGTFTGGITGSGGLVLAGGSQTLSGSTSFTGATSINSGTLFVGGTSTLIASSRVINNGTLDISSVASNGVQTTTSIVSLSGSGSVVLGGATLQITNASDTFSGVMSGAGGLTITGGTQVLTGNNTFSGATTVKSGTLALAGSGSLTNSSAIDVNGVFDVSAATSNVSITSLAGSGTVKLGGNTIELTNASTVFTGILSGSGGLTISGGTQTLSGANSYTGGTTISGGVLELGDGVNNGSIVGDITNNGRLVFNQATASTFSGIIAGAGGVTQAGTGTTALTGSNSYTGGTRIASGTLQIGNGGTSGSIVGDVLNEGTLAFNRSDSITFSGTISGSGGVSILGGGTVTLSAINSYSGTTNISSISGLSLGSSGSISASSNVINNGVLDLTSAVAPKIVSLGGSGQVLLGASSLEITNSTDTFSGSISGSGGLTVSGGKAVLAGTSSYTGATTVNGGTLQVDGSILSSSGVTVNSGGTLSGSGTVSSVSIASSGTLAPSNGTLKVNGDLSLANGSGYVANLSSTSSANVTVTGSATLAGTLSVETADGTYPLGERVAFLSANGGINGSFALSPIASTGAEFKGTLSYDANNAYIQIDLSRLSPLLPTEASVNQTNVVAGIDAAIASGATLPIEFNRLGNLSPAELQSTADQASGEIGSVAGQVGAALSAPLLNSIFHHMSQGPKAAAGAKRVRPSSGAQFWVSAHLGSTTIGGETGLGAHKLHSQNSGIIAGLDWTVSPRLTIGGAFSVAKARFDLTNSLGEGQADAFQGAAYGSIRFTPNIYGAFAGAISLNNTSTTRTLSISGTDILAAKVDVLGFSGRYETGIKLGSLSPYLAVQSELFSVPAYAESATSGASTFALQYQSQQISSATLEVGARQSAVMPVGKTWSLELSDRFAWAHNTAGRSTAKAAFIALPGSEFTTYGPTQGKDAALVSVGAQLKNQKGLEMSLRLDSAISSKSQSYTGMGGLRLSW